MQIKSLLSPLQKLSNISISLVIMLYHVFYILIYTQLWKTTAWKDSKCYTFP